MRIVLKGDAVPNTDRRTGEMVEYSSDRQSCKEKTKDTQRRKRRDLEQVGVYLKQVEIEKVVDVTLEAEELLDSIQGIETSYMDELIHLILQ